MNSLLAPRRLLLLLLSIIAIWLLSVPMLCIFQPALRAFNGSDSLDDLARIGDSFGAINSLFSGLALAGVVVAIAMQRQELSLQRQELSLTRDELKRAADSHEETQRIQLQQLEIAQRTAQISAMTALLNYATERQSEGSRSVSSGVAGSFAAAEAKDHADELRALLAEIRKHRSK
jgi:PDZ domain-containing secreted protein